jgi:hypothetical protein
MATTTKNRDTRLLRIHTRSLIRSCKKDLESTHSKTWSFPRRRVVSTWCWMGVRFRVERLPRRQPRVKNFFRRHHLEVSFPEGFPPSWWIERGADVYRSLEMVRFSRQPEKIVRRVCRWAMSSFHRDMGGHVKGVPHTRSKKTPCCGSYTRVRRWVSRRIGIRGGFIRASSHVLEEFVSYVDWFLCRRLLWVPISRKFGFASERVIPFRDVTFAYRKSNLEMNLDSAAEELGGWTNKLVRLVKASGPAAIFGASVEVALRSWIAWTTLSISAATATGSVMFPVALLVLTPKILGLGTSLLRSATFPLRAVGGLLYVQFGRRAFKKLRKNFRFSLVRRGWRRRWLCGSCGGGEENVELGLGAALPI